MPQEAPDETVDPKDPSMSSSSDSKDWVPSHDAFNGALLGPGFDTVAIAAVAAGACLLMRSPELRAVLRNVLQDPDVSRVCHDAGKMAVNEIAASWRRNGGTTALAGAFLR